MALPAWLPGAPDESFLRQLIMALGEDVDLVVGDDLAPEVRAHDRQGPVVVLPDAAGGDVGVLGGEVGTGLAPFAGPGVAFLQRHFVVVAVVHPDLEHALDVDLLHVLLAEAVLGLEQLLEDGVVERLGAQQADVEDEGLPRLAQPIE